MRKEPPPGQRRDGNALLCDLAAGDPNALGEIYDIFAPRLTQYFARRISDEALRDDLVQETMTKIFSARARFDPSYKAEQWIFSIAGRQLVDQLRLQRRKPEVPAADEAEAQSTGKPSPESQLDTRQRQHLLNQAVSGLGHKQREALRLVIGEGLTCSEAAKLLHVPPNAVKKRLYRATKRLGQSNPTWRAARRGESGPESHP